MITLHRLVWVTALLLAGARESLAHRHKADVVVIGAGPGGATYTQYLHRHHPSLKIAVIEKQPGPTSLQNAQNGGKARMDQRIVLQDLPLNYLKRLFGSLPDALTPIDFLTIFQGKKLVAHKFPPRARKSLGLSPDEIVHAYRYPQKMTTFSHLSQWLRNEVGRIEGIRYLPGYTADALSMHSDGVTVKASPSTSGQPIEVDGRLLVVADGRSPLINQLPGLGKTPNPYPETGVTGVLSQQDKHKRFLGKLVIAEGKIGKRGTGALVVGTKPNPALVVMTPSDQVLDENGQRQAIEEAANVFEVDPPRDIFPFATPKTWTKGTLVGSVALIGGILVPLRTGSNISYDLLEAETLAKHTPSLLTGTQWAREQYLGVSQAHFGTVKTWAEELTKRMNRDETLLVEAFQHALRKFLQ